MHTCVPHFKKALVKGHRILFFFLNTMTNRFNSQLLINNTHAQKIQVPSGLWWTFAVETGGILTGLKHLYVVANDLLIFLFFFFFNVALRY